MPMPSLLWFDYETTGTDPVRDRPLQFAAQRTDLALQAIDDGATWYCKPAPDVLPQPEACLITGLAPQDADRDGCIEAEFAARVHEALAEPGTCSVGYNSIRFDDELNRNLFRRNFFDPYEHAWRNGNARWDIMDLARACYALRPEGIAWPEADGGGPSFKLDRLAPANHLEQARAHEALSDVGATLALARLLRQRQPRLYDWHFALRDKHAVASRLADAMSRRDPLLHVSGRYLPDRGCLAMVVPLAEIPGRAGSFIVADLGVDPRGWADVGADELADRLFTPRADLPEDMERPPLKAVHANRSPFLAPVSVLKDTDTARIALDADTCLANLGTLRGTPGLEDKVRRVFAQSSERWPERSDPECRLYAGFASPADQRRLAAVRATPPARLATHAFDFDNPDYAELLFRYRARNWPETLANDEHDRWRAWVRDKLTRDLETTTLTLEDYRATLARLRTERPPGAAQHLLDQLDAWGEDVAREFGL
ncbi:MAG TPA: exodeoxyribonuclease I [Rhodanobacteraceae bacterium]|nr:exodeoxyribonuclease I [Rhodanobacteraceae bacterium]